MIIMIITGKAITTLLITGQIKCTLKRDQVLVVVNTKMATLMFQK